MQLLKACLIFLYLLPAVVQAEIWAYQVQGQQISDCNKRPEASIDDVWDVLENATGIQFNLSRDSRLLPGYILENKERNAQYTFYPSKRACEFEREALAVLLSGDQERLQRFKEDLTIEKQLEVMSPADIPELQRQRWMNAFAGCTDGALKQLAPSRVKGSLQKVVGDCDCLARKVLMIDDKAISEEIFREKTVEFAVACQREAR